MGSLTPGKRVTSRVMRGGLPRMTDMGTSTGIGRSASMTLS